MREELERVQAEEALAEALASSVREVDRPLVVEAIKDLMRVLMDEREAYHDALRSNY